MNIYHYASDGSLIAKLEAGYCQQYSDGVSSFFAYVDGVNPDDYVATISLTPAGASSSITLTLPKATRTVDGAERVGYERFLPSTVTQIAGAMAFNLYITSKTGTVLVTQTGSIYVNASSGGAEWDTPINEAQWQEIVNYIIGLNAVNLGTIADLSIFDDYKTEAKQGSYYFAYNGNMCYLTVVADDIAGTASQSFLYIDSNLLAIDKRSYASSAWSAWERLDNNNEIVSIEQTASSTASGGVNTIQITLSNGTKHSFDFYNGQQGVVSGGPSGVYPTLTDLQTAYPTGNDHVYIISADGKWYYWSTNGSAWTAGGTYQATAIADGSVAPKQTSFMVVNMDGNLIDTNAIASGYIDTSGDVSGSLYYHTGYIPVVAGQSYDWSQNDYWVGTRYYAFYDEDKVFISGSNANNLDYTHTRPLVAPANAAYLRISLRPNLDLDTLKARMWFGHNSPDFSYVINGVIASGDSLMDSSVALSKMVDSVGIKNVLYITAYMLNNGIVVETVDPDSGAGTVSKVKEALDGGDVLVDAMTSTFSGLVYCLGNFSEHIKIAQAIMVSRDGAATKAKCSLWEGDEIAYYPPGTSPANSPTLVASKEVDFSGAANAPTLVDFVFDDEVVPQSGKYLWIAFELNGLINAPYIANLTAFSKLSQYYEAGQTESNVAYTVIGNYSDMNSYHVAWDSTFLATNHFRSIPFRAGSLKYDFVFEGAVSETQVNELIKNSDYVTNASLSVPADYYLVAGDTFQLFYRGVIKSFSPYDKGLFVECDVGKAFPRYFEWTPSTSISTAETHTIKFYLRSIDGTIIDQKTSTLHVSPKVSISTPTTKSLLAIGDSLTAGGMWFTEGMRRIISNDAVYQPTPDGVTALSFNTMGTIVTNVRGMTVRSCGMSGWRWDTFITHAADPTDNQLLLNLTTAHGLVWNSAVKSVWTDNNGIQWELESLPSITSIMFNRKVFTPQSQIVMPTSITNTTYGTLQVSSGVWQEQSPFWNANTSQLDFVAFSQEYGVSAPDYCTILLSWNQGPFGTSAVSFDFESSIATMIANATTLIDTMHAQCPNTKIIVQGLQLPSINGGLANNYGATKGYGDAWRAYISIFAYDEALEALCASRSSYCVYSDTKSLFDTENNMPQEAHAVNVRSVATEMRGINGVHPAEAGYLQIGDAFYRALTYLIDL